MPSPLFRSLSSNLGSTSNSAILNKPAGTVDGDVLITFINIDDSTTVTVNSVPAGWTEFAPIIYDTVANPQFVAVQAFYKVASGEPASWTWGFSESQYNDSVVVAYSGGSSVTPVDSSISTNTGTIYGIIAHAAIPGFNTESDNETTVFFYAAYAFGIVVVPVSGYSSVGPDPFDSVCSIEDKSIATSGTSTATGDFQLNGDTGWAAIQIAIRSIDGFTPIVTRLPIISDPIFFGMNF